MVSFSSMRPRELGKHHLDRPTSTVTPHPGLLLPHAVTTPTMHQESNHRAGAQQFHQTVLHANERQSYMLHVEE